MKKLFAIFLALLLIPCAGAGFAFAAEPEFDVDSAEQQVVDQEMEAFYEVAAAQMREYYENLGYTEVKRPSTLEQVCDELGVASELQLLASMDVDSAPAEVKDDILAARREIIYSADGWYADNAGIYLVWFDNAKKEWGELPRFSELFPGWELPTVDSADIVADEGIEPAAELMTAESLFNGSVSLKKPSATALTAPFKTWELTNAFYTFEETITALRTSTSANLGITDLSVTPNVDVAYDTYLYVDGGLRGIVPGRNYPKLGFRASTFSNPGYATIKIEIEKQ